MGTLNTSDFYYPDELYSDERPFAFSSVSSNNTDVETTEQFILMHTRYVCEFSGLASFSQKLFKLEENIHVYRILFSSSVFLLLTLNEFFHGFQGKKFRLKTACLFQTLIVGQFIRRSVFPDHPFSCWLLRKLQASSFARSVKFLSLLLE